MQATLGTRVNKKLYNCEKICRGTYFNLYLYATIFLAVNFFILKLQILLSFSFKNT